METVLIFLIGISLTLNVVLHYIHNRRIDGLMEFIINQNKDKK